MFERFTDRSRRVIVLAQEEARMLNHNYIGTEHILLGLIHEGDGVACRALVSLGISLEATRKQIEEIIGQGQQSPTGHIPFTPRAKKVLDFGLREALQLGHNYIGTEHVLLGLIREDEGVGAQVLVKLGAELPRVRRQVIILLSGGAGKRIAETKGGKPLNGKRCQVCRIEEAPVPIWLIIPHPNQPFWTDTTNTFFTPGALPHRERLSGTGRRIIFVPPGSVAAATWKEAMAWATKGEIPRKLAEVYPDYCGVAA